MCTNYIIPEQSSIAGFFGSLVPTFEYPREAWPMYSAPMLTMSSEAPMLEPHRAMFGLVPPWAKDLKYARKTYNARSETVATLNSYKKPWKQRQFCLIPTDGFYEPNYEGGKPVRWLIKRKDDAPFALAGIWETRRDESGTPQYSFSMLTINAEEHPIMKCFHAPTDEKRSVVVVEPANYTTWLQAVEEEDARSYLKLFDPEQFTTLAAPRSAKASRTI
jgi:putative SOS response-associated peptidase YedK